LRLAQVGARDDEQAEFEVVIEAGILAELAVKVGGKAEVRLM
jgi:hypothetical protein